MLLDFLGLQAMENLVWVGQKEKRAILVCLVSQGTKEIKEGWAQLGSQALTDNQGHKDFKAQWDFQENTEYQDRRESWGPRALQDCLASEVIKAPMGSLENLVSLGTKASLG